MCFMKCLKMNSLFKKKNNNSFNIKSTEFSNTGQNLTDHI